MRFILGLLLFSKIVWAESRVGFIHEAGKTSLTPATVAYIEKLQKLISQWGNQTPFPQKTGFWKFIKDEVLSDDIEYLLVAQLPEGCGDVMEVEGKPVEQYSCTIGKRTWIIPNLFNKLSDEEKVGGIVHERMHGLDVQITHEAIGAIVRGIVLFQQILDKAESGDCGNLTMAQKDTLINMLIVGKGLHLLDHNSEVFRIHEKGGGMVVKTASMGENVCVSVGSLIYGQTVELGDNSFLIGVRAYSYYPFVGEVPYPIRVGSHTKISHSVFDGCEIGANGQVSDSHLYRSTVGNDSAIDKSLIQYGKLANRASVSNSKVGGLLPVNYFITLGHYVAIVNSSLYSQLGGAIGKGTKISDTKISVHHGSLTIMPNLLISGYQKEIVGMNDDLTISESIP